MRRRITILFIFVFLLSFIGSVFAEGGLFGGTLPTQEPTPTPTATPVPTDTPAPIPTAAPTSAPTMLSGPSSFEHAEQLAFIKADYSVSEENGYAVVEYSGISVDDMCIAIQIIAKDSTLISSIEMDVTNAKLIIRYRGTQKAEVTQTTAPAHVETITTGTKCRKCGGTGNCTKCFGKGYVRCPNLYCANGQCIKCGGWGYHSEWDSRTQSMRDINCNYCAGGLCKQCFGLGEVDCTAGCIAGTCPYCIGGYVYY